MDFEDTENEVSVSSVISNSINSQQKEDLSPEDLAWVDSCLIIESDISGSNWIPLKNALLEIINSEPQSFNTDRTADTEMLPSSEQIQIQSIDNLESSAYDAEHSSEPSSTYNGSPLSIAAKTSANEIPDDEKTEAIPSLTVQGNPFLPTYSEDRKENGTIDLGLNLDSLAYEMDQASENIFKIWDLDIPSDEGELVKQLDKALSENSLQMMPSSFDDSGKSKNLNGNSLDDLVTGIADLSLNQNSS